MKNHLVTFVLSGFLSIWHLTCFGQKQTAIIQYKGNITQLICHECELNDLARDIKKRLNDYPIDTNRLFRLEKNDTLLELVEFNNKGFPNYSYYRNNLLKVRYTELSRDSNHFVLTVMNDFEMEQKTLSIEPNESHQILYDQNSNMEIYQAVIFHDLNIKREYEKKWENGKFKSGYSKTLQREQNEWTLIKTEKIGALDWPVSTKGIPSKNESEIDEWITINSTHFYGTFNLRPENSLELNTDSTSSLLPFRLKPNLANGTYRFYKKISKKYNMEGLILDANILNGQLHGVYNEYDIESGKLRIYCLYSKGKLNGRRTIYLYDKKGKLENKVTEMWIDGKFVGKSF